MVFQRIKCDHICKMSPMVPILSKPYFPAFSPLPRQPSIVRKCEVWEGGEEALDKDCAEGLTWK